MTNFLINTLCVSMLLTGAFIYKHTPDFVKENVQGHITGFQFLHSFPCPVTIIYNYV